MKGVRPRMPGISRKTKRMVLSAKLSEHQRSCAFRHDCISPGKTKILSRSKRMPVNKHGCCTSVLFNVKRENGNGRAIQKPPGLSNLKVRVWGLVCRKQQAAALLAAT